MYNKNEIEDSLEFVKQIKIYETCDPCDLTGMIKARKHEDTNIISAGRTPYLKCEEYPVDTTEQFVRGFYHDVLYIILCMVISIGIAYGLTHYVAHHTKVDGNSMRETLHNDDYLVIERVSYYFHGPERYDIVVFPYSDGVNYIKRVIGLPGEKLQIIEGEVYINDELLTTDIYGAEKIKDPGQAHSPIYLKEDEYFVLGDNRNKSFDSRQMSVGKINRKSISGKAVFRFWPLDSFGSID